jgi:endonuclease/exonuclease/phosphatase family metal-dependent hydrolase
MREARVASHDGAAAAHTFTVASVNLHCGVASTGEPFDVESVIRGLDATIIAVQETWQTDSQPGTRHYGPTIVVGDLNMPGPIARLTAGYARAATGRTWPASRPRLQLDHVLTSSHLESLAGTVLPCHGSDHLPVRARLRLRAAGPGVRRAAVAAASRAR